MRFTIRTAFALVRLSSGKIPTPVLLTLAYFYLLHALLLPASSSCEPPTNSIRRSSRDFNMLELANMTTEAPPPSFQTSWSASESDSAALTTMDVTDQPLNGSATDSAAAAQNANGANNNNRVAVAVACVQCRSRHLKCDGATRCSRCVAEGIACSYVKSRRGWKGPRKSSQRLVTVHPPGSNIGTIIFFIISKLPSSALFIFSPTSPSTPRHILTLSLLSRSRPTRQDSQLCFAA